MKKAFAGYFPPTDDELDELWKNCLFVVDTNILLNLYRYSDTTRNNVIKILQSMKERLWLPSRAAEEYFNNRLSVISQQEKAYEDAIKTIQNFQGDLHNTRQHPFLSAENMNKLNDVLKNVIDELGINKNHHSSRTEKDEIQQIIGELFENRVGTAYPEAELEKICKEGEERFNRRVPPGYKDFAKDDASSPVFAKYRKYGDFIIWRQILDKAKDLKTDIIFVSDDKKEDWWSILKGKTLGPRPELISEFITFCNQGFYMYQADRFFEYAAKYLKQELTEESVTEIRDLKSNIDYRSSVVESESDLLSLDIRLSHCTEKLSKLETMLDYVENKTEQLQHYMDMVNDDLARSGGEDEKSLEAYLKIQSEMELLEKQKTQLHAELAAVQAEQAMIRARIGDITSSGRTMRAVNHPKWIRQRFIT